MWVAAEDVLDETRMAKFLEIGTYPPPLCGWAMQTKLLVEELRRRGHVCQALNLNENRKKKSPDYVDVQNELDYVYKLLRFGLAGFRFHGHCNAMSAKQYLQALGVVLVGRLVGRAAALTFHGGLPQTYFPRPDSRRLRWAYQLLFGLAGRLSCDSAEIRDAILSYGIPPEKVAAIPCFSAEMLDFRPAPLPGEVEAFLAGHHPNFFCYLSFRPEYHLDVLREAMKQFRQKYPRSGFIWLGFPEKELREAQAYARAWPTDEAAGLLLLGNLKHDGFLTLLSRSFAFLRTPACDGISGSVLESLALGVPVVASENGRRPAGVVTYRERDASDLAAKLAFLTEHSAQVKSQTKFEGAERNIQRAADWLAGAPAKQPTEELAHVG